MLTKKISIRYILQPLIHVGFWVVVYFFYNYFLGYGSDNIEYVNKFSLYLMPVTIALSYIVIYFLVPNYLFKKKYGLFILYSIYTFVFSFFAILLSIFYGLIFSSYLIDENSSPITKTLPLIILGVFFVVLLVSVLSLIAHSYKSVVKNEDLKNKILKNQLQLKEQELKFLKMQIHPHFLFNSLNTIYGFALKKSDEAPEMILKLSNLLDYILYQIDKPKVLLKDEIAHLQNYIALEKMRFHDTLKVTSNFSIANEQLEIAPMLLIPFVENSFKHGSVIKANLKVDIELYTTKNELFFNIVNSSNSENDTTMGIGLKNIKKRLEMLYPEMFTLEITNVKNQFNVTLQIVINQLKTQENVT